MWSTLGIVFYVDIIYVSRMFHKTNLVNKLFVFTDFSVNKVICIYFLQRNVLRFRFSFDQSICITKRTHASTEFININVSVVLFFRRQIMGTPQEAHCLSFQERKTPTKTWRVVLKILLFPVKYSRMVGIYKFSVSLIFITN